VPLYEYVCQPNGHRFEVRHGMNEPPPPGCPECGGPIRRVIHPVGIMFKGSGFYATDSRQSQTGSKSAAGTAKSESGGDASSESKSGSDSAKPASTASEPAKD
jgi:putative FmdB family regulatory protein